MKLNRVYFAPAMQSISGGILEIFEHRYLDRQRSTGSLSINNGRLSILHAEK